MSKKFFKFFGFFLIACAGIFGLSACDNKEEFKVEFMVQDTNNAWTVLKEEKVVEGAVALPEAPAKTYYTFAGWFGEEALSTKFEGKDIKASAKAYAKYTPNQVKITINGEDQGNKNLIDVVNATYNPGEGLEFNGWYKDSACKVKWDYKDDVTELFAESVALITYTNGYETLWTEMVKPGTVLGTPSTRLVEDKTTFEAKYIVKNYMSDRDIEYLDENNKAIDFTKAITRSMNVNVKWHSPYSDGCYRLNEKTGNYYMEFYTKLDFPVLSFGSDVTIMENEVAKKITVEAIHIYGAGWLSQNTKKIIFNDGIKSIKGINGEGVCAVEEIVLPNSVKIIDGSFNNMPKLKEVKLPEGLEIIIGSFFKASKSDYKTYKMGTVHDFDINVPASVTNMAHVPNNFTFAEGSKFYKGEDKCIYLNSEKGKILISDPQAYSTYDKDPNGFVDTITVPSCDGIQVGTYNVVFNYMFLPESFKFVNFNANLEDHTYYIGMEGSAYSFSSIALFDEKSKDAPSTKMAPIAYSITNYLGGLNNGLMAETKGAGVIVFANEKLPETLDKLAFTGDATGWAVLNGAYQDITNETLKEKVVLKDATNKVFVTTTVLTYIPENPDWGEPAFWAASQITVSLTDATINQDAIIAAMVALNADLQATFDKATSIKYYANGKEVTLGEVTSDMYITMEIVLPEENPQA